MDTNHTKTVPTDSYGFLLLLNKPVNFGKLMSSHYIVFMTMTQKQKSNPIKIWKKL